MKFQMSTNITVGTTNVGAAKKFYSDTLGFNLISEKEGFAEVDLSPIRMFVQRDEQVKGVVMELFVDDLEAAKEYLIQKGCKIIRWRGIGQECYIEDPFGLRFNSTSSLTH